jgi:class 3 adenylate cyclase
MENSSNQKEVKKTRQIEENIVEAEIAIVLTDIIGSTKFVQKNGSRIAAKWFSIHDKAVMNFIQRHNGRLVDASDGHLMYFGTVGDAIAFSFEYKKYLRVKKFPFRSRVGIHWDKMLIVKSEEHLVRAGGKRINLEGIGKNIAARTMSLCSKEQILLSSSAYKRYKQFGHRNRFIPKNALTALVGLYKFKGVTEPEAIYAVGQVQLQLQPPPDSEKAKRVGGHKKIKTKLRHKKILEIFWWLVYRLFWIALFLLFWFIAQISLNSFYNDLFKFYLGIDLFYWLGPTVIYIKKIISLVLNNI